MSDRGTRAPVGLHETDADIANERRIVHWLAGVWGVKDVRFLPKGYHADAMAFSKDGSYCFLEARKRGNESTKYPTLSVSLQKWIGLIDLSRFAKTFYIVEWTDTMGYHEVTDENFPLFFMERGTGDPRDNEPVINIPMDRFTLLRRKGQ